MKWLVAAGERRLVAKLAVAVAAVTSVVMGWSASTAAAPPVLEEPPAVVVEPTDSQDPDPPIGGYPKP